MDNFNKILPGNPRYQPKEMEAVFAYDNLYKKVALVEIVTLETLGSLGVIKEQVIKKLDQEAKEKLLAIKTTEVDKIEREITHHDIRAWVRAAQEILPSDLAKWVHIPLTSYDVIDTARILQYREAYQTAIKPAIKKTVKIYIELIEKFANQKQIGRTHGQHALPITVGFWLATILNRIIYNWENFDNYSNNLVGKISGAVGAHNAQLGLGFSKKEDASSFEEKVLDRLGLKPARISTQILPPEPLGFFLFSAVCLSSTLGQFGRDSRHLMRSEIGEIIESFEKGQVGSSTMAHKRNPISFENLEGMWLRTKNEFGKILDTMISEHQRDLVGSSVARDYPIILINLQCQLNTLLRKNKSGLSFLERISVNEEACNNNFSKNANVILAEPLYIALQMAGYEGDAHELVNHKLVGEAQKSGRSLIDVLEEVAQKDEALKKIVGNMPESVKNLLKNPDSYTGDASSLSLAIAENANNILNKLK